MVNIIYNLPMCFSENHRGGIMEYHFGLKLGSRKDGHKLTRDNYAIVNNKTSLFDRMIDYFFNDDKYKKMPKEWTIRYFAKMIEYCNNVPKSKRPIFMNRRIEFIEKELANSYNTHENYKIILEKTISLNEQLKDKRKFKGISISELDFIRMFDWENDITGCHYTDEWCKKQEKDVMENFDLNMKFFECLELNEFEKQISSFKNKYKQFVEITDLNPYMDASGYYILIVDKYKQLYVGTSITIGKRIRQHWNARKQFDRLLFPMGAIDKSIIPFDSFRALDITRILVYKTNKVFDIEDEYISQFDARFVGNRMSGGIPHGLLHAIAMTKSRELT
jgi:hypothetical protein